MYYRYPTGLAVHKVTGITRKIVDLEVSFVLCFKLSC